MIPVVQAFCYTKYMGHMKLSFDQDGELLTPVNGTGVSFAEPLLLDEKTIQDNFTLEAMVKWQNNLTEYREVVGENTVYMGKSEIDSEESNIGRSSYLPAFLLRRSWSDVEILSFYPMTTFSIFISR